ncbi:MAG: hypothetical protein IJY62_01770 [Clostridia bacterium]|nr:hypothetical protein [Clostridia bacterium]
MRHAKNTVRYYLILTALLIFLFFSNDFGLIDIQKTAIVLAAGIDRDGATFIVTTQIAVPKDSEQGGSVQAVQIESRGATVAEAFNQINAKTGWYPKLVFCDLLVLGKTATERNVFEALDYFLRDEYMSDGCLVAACDGSAKDILNAQTPIEGISSLAAQKVLSEHAVQSGMVAVNSLRTFAIGYYGAGKSGYLPIIKTESPEETPSKSGDSGASGGSSSGGENSGSSGGGSGGSEGSTDSGNKKESVYSASETALFYDGVMTGRLNAEETFALCVAKEKLKLASYSLEHAGCDYALQIKTNEPKIKFSVDKNARAHLKINVELTAGIQDISSPQAAAELLTGGNIPKEIFGRAKEKLSGEIQSVFEKSRNCKCDVFGILERLQKFEAGYYSAFKEDILERLDYKIEVSFESLR